MNGSDVGVLACGAYLPRARLPGSLLGDAHGWFEPSLVKGGERRRSFCNWDEDPITMAVEASRSCLQDIVPDSICRVELASTTLPFADRSNAGLLREALDLPDGVNLADSGGSLRAASSAMIRALSNADKGNQLVIGSDCVDSRPASAQEATHGHGAAAVVVGSGEPLATLKSTVSLHQDFVDHYRASGERFDYTLEARWTRDAGYRQQARDVYARALAEAGLAAGKIDHTAIAAPPVLVRSIAKTIGVEETTGDDLQNRVGFCGAAQPVLLLTAALQAASPGHNIALVSVGQGIDVIVLEVVRNCDSESLAAQIAGGVDESNYCRYLSLRRILALDEGIRAERDNRTAHAAAWRKHDAITGFKGGQCPACNTLQFPQSKVCVSCGTQAAQTPRRLADMPGKVRSFTEDWLAFTPKPPLIFGNVGFGCGANVMMEFTDFDAGQVAVGMSVRMRFRIKDFDDRRHFRRYFWKPAPAAGNGSG